MTPQPTDEQDVIGGIELTPELLAALDVRFRLMASVPGRVLDFGIVKYTGLGGRQFKATFDNGEEQVFELPETSLFELPETPRDPQ